MIKPTYTIADSTIEIAPNVFANCFNGGVYQIFTDDGREVLTTSLDKLIKHV